MDDEGQWVVVDRGVLEPLVAAADDDDIAGYQIGPLPDKVWLLHPLSERVDGQAIDYDFADDPPERPVRWADYAARRGIELLPPRTWPGINGALPGAWEDDYVSPPSEGYFDHEVLGSALFDVLLRHSAQGPATTCFAYWYWFYVGGPHLTPEERPDLLRGPLGAWRHLFDRDDYALSPQNVWPEDFAWVVQTHTDAWATAVSGPTALVEDLLASPVLEAVRLPELE